MGSHVCKTRDSPFRHQWQSVGACAGQDPKCPPSRLAFSLAALLPAFLLCKGSTIFGLGVPGRLHFLWGLLLLSPQLSKPQELSMEMPREAPTSAKIEETSASRHCAAISEVP